MQIICTVFSLETAYRSNTTFHLLAVQTHKTRNILMARDFFVCFQDVERENNWNVVDGTWNIQFHTGWDKKEDLLLVYRCQLLLFLSLTLSLTTCVFSWFVKTNRNYMYIAPSLASKIGNEQTCKHATQNAHLFCLFRCYSIRSGGFLWECGRKFYDVFVWSMCDHWLMCQLNCDREKREFKP